MKATPTPWQISPVRTTEDTAMIVGGEGFEFGLIADVTEDYDAAFIVEAVNSRATLKARVAELEAECNRWAEASIAEDYRRVEWRKALLEIEDLGENGATAARLSNIARAALSHAEAGCSGWRAVMAETFDGLKYLIQYRRKDDGVRWQNMAAFDVVGTAERYFAKLSKDEEGWPWEYRFVDLDAEEQQREAGER